jgi:hypothetical protein
LNRKWFIDNFGEDELQNYSIFKATSESPKYYKPYRHFYWEILGIALVNSSFFSIFIINLFTLLKFEAKNYISINWFWFILITIVATKIILYIYKKRGLYEEARLNRKL